MSLAPDPYAFMLPFYDQWSAHMTGDVPFYVEQAVASGGPVVELGAGNGRVTIPVARASIDVVAVDISDAMLTESARRADAEGVLERITFVRSDMASFVADEPVPLVIIPFRSFMHNLTTEAQLRTLASIRASLRDDGLLVMNMFTMDPHIVAAYDGVARMQADYTDERGRRCEVWATSRYVTGPQLIHVTAELRVFEGERLAAVSDSTFTLRAVYRYEFEHLLARSGLEPVSLHGGFDGRPYGPGPDEMVWTVRKA